jgi:hypothetical protein
MIEGWIYRDAVDVHHRKKMQDDSCESLDPFGVVLWPGAQLIAERLSRPPLSELIKKKNVLCLGVGEFTLSVSCCSFR